ncbi:hypothetical protein PZH42_31200, partial [Bacteroides cellulosilyticus]|nr:hypothetical protein [Bacteroides cellulosilyticus]
KQLLCQTDDLLEIQVSPHKEHHIPRMIEPGGLMSAIQTSAMLSRRIWRKLHFSVEAKYLFLPERATQTFEKRNLLTGKKIGRKLL